MHRGAKIAVWVAAGLLTLVVLLLGTLMVIGNTESGRALIVRVTAQLTKGHVRLAGIHGSFPAALDLDRLELSDAQGVWLFAEHISLRWSPSALLVRDIKVDSLHVARLHIERAPLPEKEPKPSSTPSIPHTDLGDLSIDALELGKGLAGKPVSLAVRGAARLRSLENATAHVVAQRTGGIGHYELQLQFDPARMDATLSLQEPANGPLENFLQIPGLGDLSVMVKVNGPRSAESIDLTMNAGLLRGRALGKVDLVEKSADLDYALSAPSMTPHEGLTWQAVDLKGRFHGPFKTPTADGHLLVKELRVPGGTQLETLDAQLTANLGLMKLRAAIDGLVVPGPQPALFQDSRVSVDASVRLDDPKRPLQLEVTHRLLALKARAVTAGEQSAQLDLKLPDIQPFAALGGQKVAGDADIKAQVKYAKDLTSLTAELNANIDGGTAAWAGLVRGGPTRLQLGAQLTDKKLTVERLQLNGRAVSLTADGTVARTQPQDINVRLELGLADLAQVSPALAGSLKLSGRLKGPTDSLSADTELTSTLSIHGSPRGTVSASIRADGLPKLPRGTIEAHGDLDGSPLQLDVLLQRDKDLVHAFIRRAEWKSLQAAGDFTAGSELAQARGSARFRMSQLSDLDRLLGSHLQGSVAGNVQLQPVRGRSQAQLQVDAKDISAGGALTTNAQLTANGRLDALDVKLDAQSPSVGGEPASLTSEALLNVDAKELRLQAFAANYHNQTLKLLAPARLSFADGFAVSGLKLGAQEAVVEAEGRITPQLDLHASLRQLKPALINAFVPNLLASGTIQADAQVAGSTSAPTGKVSLDATGLKGKSDAARGLPPTDIHATAQLMGNTADIDAKLTAASASRLVLAGRAPLAADGALDVALTGNLDVGLLNPLLEAGGRHVTGAVAIDTRVTGTAASPEIAGTVRLTHGSLRDYAQGVNLSDITGELSGGQGQLRIEKLTARAAPGDVAIEGTIGVLQPKLPVDLRMTARNAQPIANNIVTANLNADIKVTGTARERLDVTGKVDINRADVGIPNGLPPNVAVLDVRRPGQAPPTPPERPLIIALNITVDAPRQILVKGRGLDAELGGELRIRGTTESPSVSGGFELQRGYFTLGSSKLTFSNGTVSFTGAGLKNKIDPALDFTAQTQVLDITAVVRITGLADAPKIELSSTPELPQDEILARVLFGQQASQLTALQVVQIGAALASLSGGGSDSFNPVAKIQKALGLDRLAVGGGNSSNSAGGSQQNTGASIEAGRYVSSRVFVAVKESTTGSSQIVVDVDLSKHLKLQTKLGNGNTSAQGTTPENDPGSSVGLAYQFEY
jgi:translocation and assembly module TamB